MSKFYTSVERFGNNILWRGYENGKSFSRRVKYQPTLFTGVRHDTKYKSLSSGKYLEPTKMDSMRDAKDYIEQYKDVHGFEIAGSSNYVAQFIQENYPGEIKYDPSLINIVSFDI
ncbi:MAG TPA: DNA polymerase, partial [Saprospirales bacterium]|nr:DNA polymerase [Saprospirales bacterium]